MTVTQEDQQSQETIIKTDQDQTFETENQTDYVKQEQKTVIDTKQEGEIKPSEEINTIRQETEVEVKQKHHSETSGNAKVQQDQSIEAVSNSSETNSEDINIKAEARNGIEVMKKATQTVVRVLQSIFVNDQGAETFDQEFIIDKNGVKQSQSYTQNYHWGTLTVINNVLLKLTKDNDLESFLESIIHLNFLKNNIIEVEEDYDNNIIEVEEDYDIDKNGVEQSQSYTQNYHWGTPTVINNVLLKLTKDNNLESFPESIIHLNFLKNNIIDVEEDYDDCYQDSDGDGLPDCFEIKIGTNPYNPDSDGDGLSDYFEVIYHSPTSFNYSLESMVYAPTHLDPLNKDTDGNGMTDNLEDFDQDGLDNQTEQSKGTNPYNPDSDGDGLSDYFEVIYHSPTSFNYSLESMVYAPTHLDPLSKDTDGNGITDNLEDFDQDGLDNQTEQSKGDESIQS